MYGAVPSGYYDTANGLTGTSLQAALHEIINDHTKFPYTSSNTDVWDLIKITDEDPSNSSNVILLYTGRSQAKSENSGESSASGSNRWNREHVWSKSHGFPNESDTAYTDLHHLRPTDESVNSSRGTKDFDNGGSAHSEATDCNYDSDSWEPRDEVKGDVARMMFYMEVRYDPGAHSDGTNYDLELVDYTGTSTSSDNFGKLSTLITWHANDPVDAFESDRNDSIYAYQGNRNPFIDYPEFVNAIWGTTPSSPSNLSTTSLNENSLTLSWTDNANNETEYRVYQNESLISTLAADANTLTIYGLSKSTKYKFWVKSYNSDGESFPAELSVTTKGVYISEISEGTGSTTEFLELYNNNSSSVSLTGYKLVRVNASNNSSEYVFDIGTDGDGGDQSIPANGFWVISRGSNESTFTSGFSSFPSAASFYDGNNNLYFGTGTARKWRLRANDGTANTDDGTLIDETSAAAAGSGKRTIQNPTGTFTTTTSSSGGNSNPGLFDTGQRLRLLTITGNSGFRMLSSPVSGTIFNDLLSETWTQGITGSDAGSDGSANVWTLDLGNQTWTELSNMSSSSLSAGQGFLTYVFQDIDFDGDSDLPITLSVAGSSTTGDVTIGSIPSGDYYLAGNPYPQTIDWDLITKTNLSSSASVWNDETSAWKTWNGSTGDLTNGFIAPYQGFWVQANGGTGSFTIQDADVSTTAGSFLGRTVENDSVHTARFDVSMGEMTSSTYFSFTSDGLIDYDREDAPKLLPLHATSRIEIMTFANEIPLKINSLPYEIENTIYVPMEIMILDVEGGHFISRSGNVQLSWEIEDLSSYLITKIVDNLTGEIIDISSSASSGQYMLQLEGLGDFSFQNNAVSGTYPFLGYTRFQIIFQQGVVDNDKEKTLPDSFTLNSVYPNPFNPSVNFNYHLKDDLDINISVYDLNGSMVDNLFEGKMVSGHHQLEWVPTNISSGIYFVSFESRGMIFNKKVTLLK